MVGSGLLRRVSCLMVLWAACAPWALAAPSLDDEWASWEAQRRASYYRDLPGEVAQLARMADSARNSGDRHLYWMSLGRLLDGVSGLMMLPAARWAQEAEPQLAQARAAGDVLGTSALLMGLSNFELRDAHRKRARELLEEVRSLADRHGIPSLKYSADVALAFMLIGTGDRKSVV